MSQQGFLVIADITGYTAYLHDSELEHAQDSLSSLLNLLIDHTTTPLVLSRLEGDAVISYAMDGTFLQGQTLIEIIEGTYVAFKQALEMMVLNTTCTCNACKNIPNLYLKFFVHHGTFLLQQLGTHAELVGTDVNLVHRLTKNSIVEKTGIKAYTAYTEAAADALDIPNFWDGMLPHEEEYDVGRVVVHVQDMTAMWERERAKVRTVVTPENALIIDEVELPVPPTVLWDYVTKPEYRAQLLKSDVSSTKARTDGRLGDGTVYICAHGKSVYAHTVVDWQPVEQYTYQAPGVLPRNSALVTSRLTPTDQGTLATLLIGRRQGPLVMRVAENIMAKIFAGRSIRKGRQILVDLIERELADGRLNGMLSPERPNDATPEEVRKAAAESLTA